MHLGTLVMPLNLTRLVVLLMARALWGQVNESIRSIIEMEESLRY
jgi:hypothetical protein